MKFFGPILAFLFFALLVAAAVFMLKGCIQTTIPWDASAPPMEEDEGKEPPTFLSPTECIGADGKPAHGTYRWAAKVDKEQPGDSTFIQETSVKEMGGWPDLSVLPNDKRASNYEFRFWTLVGQVRLAKAEADGDLHIQLLNMQSETGYPQVVTEVPLGEPWNKIREQVFGWSSDKFPFGPKRLTLTKHPVIRVTGKAFYDGYHKGSLPNRRSYDPNLCVWEIHPIMRLEELP